MNKKLTIYRFMEKRSFRGILIFSFVFVSIIPILASQYISYNRLSRNLLDNMSRLSMTNVAQTKNNLGITIDAYHDILYQIYTNDEAVLLIRNIDEDSNRAVAINQLRRMLHGMCYAKDGIEAVTVITQGGSVICYDKLTASSVNSSWLGKDGLTINEIIKTLKTNSTLIYPTSHASDLGLKDNYLFHMAHRIIDYKQIEKDVGVAVLSINEDILRNVCNNDMPQGSFSFIVDKSGRIISYPNKERISAILPNFNYLNSESALSSYKKLLSGDGYLTDPVAVYSSDTTNEWLIVTVVDQSAFYAEIAHERKNMLIVGIIILVAAGLFIVSITTLLTRSMGKLTDAMNQAQGSDLSVQIPEGSVFSSEMMTIVHAFNKMMLRIKGLIEEVRSVSIKQKDAEIKALEAQINPHFLYNTLDSVNWMAIDKEQFEISHMITSLAKILRYSISNSNAIVPMREEIEWLRQYIYLHQIRCKYSFDYNLDIDEAVMDFPVHKLMFQPFVENSIKHGFKDTVRKNLLSISAKSAGGLIRISILDNGCGMDFPPPEGLYGNQEDGGDHIGIANAVGRIRMYYGDNAGITINSRKGAGTTVIIDLGSKVC